MNYKLVLSIAFLFVLTTTSAQVGIGTADPNASAQLEVLSTDKGVLIPRLQLTSTLDNTAITNGNVESLLIYNTATVSDVTTGFYYWTGSRWERIINETDVKGIVTAGLTVEDQLTSLSPTNALSANQGRVLKDLIDRVSESENAHFYLDSFIETGVTGAIHSLTKQVAPTSMDLQNFKVSLNGDAVASSNIDYDLINNTIQIKGIALFLYDVITVMYTTNF